MEKGRGLSSRQWQTMKDPEEQMGLPNCKLFRARGRPQGLFVPNPSTWLGTEMLNNIQRRLKTGQAVSQLLRQGGHLRLRLSDSDKEKGGLVYPGTGSQAVDE